MIDLISRHALFLQGVERALSGRSCAGILALQIDLPSLEAQIRQATILVVDAVLGFSAVHRDTGSSWAEWLRACYRGPIVFLGFAARERIGKWPGGYLIDKAGSVYGRLPLTLAELRRLVEAAIPPTAAEWEQISRIIQWRQLDSFAFSVGHEYENVFSHALSSLWELEKLGYFPEVDPGRRAKELQFVRDRLTSERLETFWTALVRLCDQAEALGLRDPSCSHHHLDTTLSEAKQALACLHLGQEGSRPAEAFPAAGRLRAILRDMLALIHSIRQHVSREIAGASQDPIRR